MAVNVFIFPQLSIATQGGVNAGDASRRPKLKKLFSPSFHEWWKPAWSIEIPPRQILMALLSAACPAYVDFDIKEALENLVEREKVSSTASGGFAQPHAKIESIGQDLVVLAFRLDPAINWRGSFDSESVRFVMLSLIPPHDVHLGLHVNALLSRIGRKFLGRDLSADDFEKELTAALLEEVTISNVVVAKRV